jgi:hypothetical protein
MCGQKLIPLTVRAALEIGDVNLGPWREIWVNRRAADLVINGVSPTFALFGNWTYLSGAGPGTFENAEMRAKYAGSEHIAGVLRALELARPALGSGRTAAAGRAAQLDARLHEALEYAREFMQLSELVLLAVAENVGYTLACFAEDAGIKRRKGFSQSPYVPRMFGESARAARYLFDLCYGAHVLHTRAGVVHGDLHLNNMTVFLNREFAEVVRDGEGGVKHVARARDARVAYVVGGSEATTYVFPHDGYVMCLIDFSRCLMGPEARKVLAGERGESYAKHVFRNQVPRALKAFQQYAPKFAKAHQERLKAALLAEEEQVFRALTAIDFLAVGRNVGALLAQLKKQGDLPVAAGAVELARAVEKQALDHLVTHLSRLVEKGERAPPALPPYAGEVLLPAVFGEYLFSRQPPESLRGCDLADIYVATAPLTYSASEYAKYPPWARLDTIAGRPGAPTPETIVQPGRGAADFLAAQQPGGGERLASLQERLRAEQGSPPGAALSCWLSTGSS